jgi:glycosyltransferase involved in cell wall biosynthesis
VSGPEISVVMPVFNAGTVVERAIQSIARQSFTGWELIAVDDGSTDDTADILSEWAQRNARVQPLYVQHGGIVDALNAGIEVARAPLIARMDADDEALPSRLADQQTFLKGQPELGVVGSLVEFAGERSEGYAAHVEWMNTIVSSEDIALNRFIESPFAHPSVMFRRNAVRQHGGYRNGLFPEDFELWLRWLDAGVRMAKVPKVLLRWNDSPGRLSRTDARYSTEAFYRCKARFLAKWLNGHVPASRPIIVWGAGRPTRKRAEFLTGYGVKIAAYIDIDPAKQGVRFARRPVLKPAEIPESAFVLSYVANRGARELIRAQLRSLGRDEGRDFLMAA